jgi:hypothetical protein
MPADPEKIQRIDVPQPDVFQPGYNGFRNPAGVLLLLKGGDNDVFFSGSFYGSFKRFGNNKLPGSRFSVQRFKLQGIVKLVLFVLLVELVVLNRTN